MYFNLDYSNDIYSCIERDNATVKHICNPNNIDKQTNKLEINIFVSRRVKEKKKKNKRFPSSSRRVLNTFNVILINR